MARSRGPLGNSLTGGALLDHLVVRLDLDISGFQRGIAGAIAQINTLKGAIANQAGGNGLQAAMTAALVAPVALATARIGQLRQEMRALTNEMRNVALIGGPGGPGGGGRNMGALVVPGGPILDANRRQGRAAGGTFGRMAYRVEGDDLADAARGHSSTAPDPPLRARRTGFFANLGRMFSPQRTADAFSEGRSGFPGFGDATDNLGGAAHSVGGAARRGVGGRLAATLGLVGLGALMGDLLKLATSLAVVIGGTLKGAFAALLTPLGLVVGLVTALVALFVAANWDQFKEFGEWFGERWRELISSEGMGDVIAGWREFTNAIDELWITIRNAFQDDSNSIGAVLRFFGEVILRTLNAAMEIIGAFLRVVAEMVRAVAALIRGDWADAWAHLGRAVEVAFRGVLDGLASFFPEVQRELTTISDWVVEKFRQMGEAAASFWANLTGGGPRGEFNNGVPRGNKAAVNDNKPRGAKGVGGLPLSAFGVSVSGVKDEGGFALTDDQEARIQRMTSLVDGFSSSLLRAGDEGIRSGAKLSDVFRMLIADLIQMAVQMLVIEPLTNQFMGAMRGVFGGGGGGKGGKGGGAGGILSAVGSFFGGFFADGGVLGPGQWGIAGENGPEIIRGGKHGMTVSPANSNMRVDARAFIDARGADPAAIARLEARLDQRDRDLPRIIAAKVGDMSQRGRIRAS